MVIPFYLYLQGQGRGTTRLNFSENGDFYDQNILVKPPRSTLKVGSREAEVRRITGPR